MKTYTYYGTVKIRAKVHVRAKDLTTAHKKLRDGKWDDYSDEGYTTKDIPMQIVSVQP